MKYMSLKKGFTLIELLTVVLIIGILAGISVPGYMRSVEKARATEAMEIVRGANDAVYAYAAERDKCPESFSKILIKVPGIANANGTIIQGKYFRYELNAAPDNIPGISCGGVIAYRKGSSDGTISVGDGKYALWNPYKVINQSTRKRTLACSSDDEEGIKICQSLGIYIGDMASETGSAAGSL